MRKTPRARHSNPDSFPTRKFFEETEFDFDTLKIRLRETAFLTKNFKITLRTTEQEEGRENLPLRGGGIREFVAYLNKGENPFIRASFTMREPGGRHAEVSMQHNDSYTEGIYTFVNNINTPEGGTHLSGFKNALTKTFQRLCRKNKLLKEKRTVCPERISVRA